MKVLAITNLKGGVAKTTTTFNLAGVLGERGKRVLLLDLDYQASLTNLFEGEDSPFDPNRGIVQVLMNGLPVLEAAHKTNLPNIEIVPSDIDLSGLEGRFPNDIDSYFLLSESLADAKDRYDYVLIDCPPNLGLATRVALVASDLYLVPVTPDRFSLRGVGYVQQVAESIKRRANSRLELAGLVFSRVQPRKIASAYIDEFKRVFGSRLLDTQLKERTSIQEASAQSKPVVSYEPNGEAAEMFRALAKEIGL